MGRGSREQGGVKQRVYGIRVARLADTRMHRGGARACQVRAYSLMCRQSMIRCMLRLVWVAQEQASRVPWAHAPCTGQAPEPETVALDSGCLERQECDGPFAVAREMGCCVPAFGDFGVYLGLAFRLYSSRVAPRFALVCLGLPCGCRLLAVGCQVGYKVMKLVHGGM